MSPEQIIRRPIILTEKSNQLREANQVVFYSDYKEFQGTRQPTRILVERDGAKFTDTQVTELRLQENADSGTFDRP